MIVAKLTSSVVGEHVAAITENGRLLDIVCGPTAQVLAALPDFGVTLENVVNLPQGMESLFGNRSNYQRPVELGGAS